MSGASPRPVGTSRGRLRLRVTAAAALASLTVVGFLGVATYLLAEHYLLRQREDSLLRQAYVDARIVRDEMQRSQEITAALASLDLSSRARVVARVGGRWYGTAVSADAASLPDRVRADVGRGAVVHQRARVEGRPVLVVGIPLDATGVDYYEIFSLEELARTLDTLRTALVVSGLAATVLGGILGWWTSRRVLRPVGDVAAAAERVARGDFDTRLVPGRDPDLGSLAASFNHMVDALEQRIERETRFVADASHELRSPLTTLSTATGLLATRRAELSPRGAKALDLVEAEVVRLRRLVEDLLELGRLDAGETTVPGQRTDVGAVVRDLPLTGADSAVSTPARPAFASIDPRRLERIVTNLVANADLHGRGLDRLVVRRGDSTVRIEVEDLGPGVDPGDRTAIFERFNRGATAGRRASTPGTGLGLSLVAEQVRLHGGRVWVEDRDVCGARFVVELPETP